MIQMNHISDYCKSTPQKFASRSHKKKLIDDAFAKDLMEPFRDSLAVNLLPAFTPLRKQPQFLLSPSPIKRDLFTQLLGTETRQNDVQDYNQSIEEESMSFEEMSEEIQEDESMDEDSCCSNEMNWSQENGIKKRKRKSTAQIKLLKQELDGEMNWTKEKIVKMAEITGLTQSQVYKWCWDQKKKQNRHRDDAHSKAHLDRRKLIRKNVSYRGSFKNHIESEESQSEQIHQTYVKEKGSCTRRDTHTKVKVKGYFGDMEQDTQKKVNKRLIFH